MSVSSPGFWLCGQCFSARSLADLWQFWHLKTPEQGLDEALEQGWVEVYENDQLQRLDRDFRLIPGQRWRFYLPFHSEAEVNSDWRILWKNHELMAVHKPANLPVSRTTRNLFQTLVSCVRRDSQYEDAHLLHRLDAETSGITLMALESYFDRKWKKRLDKLMERKLYLALVDGEPDWSQQHFGCWLAERSNSPIRSQMHCVGQNKGAAPDQDDIIKPKWAETEFHLIASEAGKSLISCRLYSGRRHQIRAQLAALGYPIVGDKIYNHQGRFYLKRLQQDLSASDLQTLEANHHLLHAFQLDLMMYGEQVKLQDNYLPASWPEWTHKWLQSMPYE